MSYKRFVIVAVCGFCCWASAQNMAELISQNLQMRSPEFPGTDAPRFSEFQRNASEGDAGAQERVFALIERRVGAVYKPLGERGGLLFSVRRPVAGLDTPSSNYTLNLKELFEKTTDRVQIRKRDFTVHSESGLVLTVRMPRYSASDATVEVSDGTRDGWIHLDGLIEKDRRFYQSALVDQIFLSSRDFIISSSDVRRAEGDRGMQEEEFISSVSESQQKGAFSSEAKVEMQRRIILENRGALPIENLLVEYQSFARQTVMKLPSDMPSDFRLVGHFIVRSIEPGETKEIEVSLPAVVMQRPQMVLASSGEYYYYDPIPAGLNPSGEGRVDGIWVRVHRITPYGERLTREYKSAGVPALPWENVAPVRADLR